MKVPVSGTVRTAQERLNLIDVAETGWYTSGKYTAQFERGLREFIGVRHAIFCNSGSSANLLAIMALTAEEHGERRLMAGDEVITVAAGFPTTINPIIQAGAIPVFVDVTIPEYNSTVDMLDRALSFKTKAVILAHTLGRPYDVKAVKEWCKANRLWLIEDCCDALGSEVDGRKVGSFGDISTLSFFPAHNITTGEGGAVLTDNGLLAKIIRSYRDWGRDCWCQPGADNTCGRRFDFPYDHKYSYSRIGYNLKATEMQAAIGVAQLAELPAWNLRRIRNFRLLEEGLRRWGAFFILPHYTDGMIPFGFPVMPKCGRRDLVDFLERAGIVTRPLFAGNIIKHKSMDGVNWRKIGDLHNSDMVYDRAFWIGCWHGLTDDHMQYVVDKFREYVIDEL